MDFIENGNVVNSVNFPAVNLGPANGDTRIAVMTKGVEKPVDLALAMFADISVKAVVGGTKGSYGYVLISTDSQITSVPKADGVVRVRVIQ